MEGFVEEAKVNELIGSVGLESTIDSVRWRFDLIVVIGISERGVKAPAEGTLTDEIDWHKQMIVKMIEIDSMIPEVSGDFGKISSCKRFTEKSRFEKGESKTFHNTRGDESIGLGYPIFETAAGGGDHPKLQG